MATLKGKAYLASQLNAYRTRVLKRYSFYEMKNIVRDLNISTPPELRFLTETLGWCGKAVDSLADRLQFKEFANDNYNLNEIYQMNNADILYDSAVTSALISSCCFIYISPDANGYPRLQVIDGSNATGILDPITGFLLEGYAVLERDDKENVVLDAYFEPGMTTFNEGGYAWQVPNALKYPLLVPVINKSDARRPFGHSRISRACMDIQDSAIRTLKRSEIAAEFYSYPQKWVTGLAQDAEIMDKWKATMASMIVFTTDDDGNHPITGQYQSQSMTPHFEQLRSLAALFCGETGLTLDDLGFATGNPSSSDAIKAAHENLRLTARKAQRQFSVGLLNAGMLAASIRDNYDYNRETFYDTKAIWYPVFEADGAAMSGIGDAIIKVNQAIPNYFDENKVNNLLGV